MAKKKYRRKTEVPKSTVRLSQCMIVKNEERNIERALSWGKDIVCEQIVVDTGSTDRTVEIAQRMGAKVLHFEWIDDFAAAKNFAIEQASGNWIAFLDADEYIIDDEAGVVIPVLEYIMSDPKMRRSYLAVGCPWVQLDDKGLPMEILEQERIFQNKPEVRYIKPIHEMLTLEETNVVHTEDFRIMHTGYTGKSFMNTDKASRNTRMLHTELEEKPEDMNNKAYLADSLYAQAVLENEKFLKSGETDTQAREAYETKLAEAEALYKEVLESGAAVHPMLKNRTYEFFLSKYTGADYDAGQLEQMSIEACREFPDDHKFMCFHAMALNKKGDFQGAFDILKKCESSFESKKGKVLTLTTNITKIFAMQMAVAAQGLGDAETALKYTEVMLLMNKTNMEVLRPHIGMLMQKHRDTGEVLSILARVYDLSSKNDLLLLARAAKDCQAVELALKVFEIAGAL